MKRLVVGVIAIAMGVASAQPAPDDPAVGSAAGSADGSGAADPAAGSGAGSGTADPGSGSADPGSGSGSGSGDPGAGSGSAAGPRIIAPPTDALAPEVNASASPTVVRLGDRFTVYITATADPGVEVNLSEPVDLGSVFEVRKKVSEDRLRADGKRTREWQLDVVAWELGDLRIPPITVTYTAFGKVGQVQSNVVRLRVEGVLGDVVDDPNAMRGLHPPAELVARDWFWLWVAAGAGGALGLLIAALVWRSRRRKRRVRLTGGRVASGPRIDMTGERALEALLAIEKAGVLARDEDRKAGYAEMVDVVRDYIAARYRVATRDLTTSELVKKLATVAPSTERDLVEPWLEACDLVKYGGVRPTADEARQTLDDARALIVTTTQLREAARVRGAAA